MKPKRTRTFAGVLVLFLAGTASGQNPGQGQAPQPPAKETVAPNIPGVIAGGTRIQVIKEGFQGTEGPIGLPDGTLIFTETAASRITKIDKDGGTSTFLENTNETNGLVFDPKGRLIGVQRAAGKQGIAVLYPKGSEAVLASNIDGKPFDRPNDLTVDKKGGVYFTDPNPGLVYYVIPGGKTIKAAEGITRPNGLLLDRDDKVLFVNDSRGEHLIAFDVQADGTVRNRRNFARYEGVQRTKEGLESSADGLAIDSEGRIYVGLPGGVQVVSPQGQNLGLIPVSKRVQNLAFAGADKKTLYMVGSGAAFKVQMLAQGFMGRAK
jgi:gluconolactonase